MRREFVRLGGMVLVPVRMNIPQVLKAEWIWEIAARDSGEEKESEVKRGAQWMTGTWLIPSDGPCFVGMEEEGPKAGTLNVLCLSMTSRPTTQSTSRDSQSGAPYRTGSAPSTTLLKKLAQ